MQTLSFEKSGYLFIESLLNPNTGLAASSADEDRTTVYTNAVAAFVLIHEANLTAAERIFDVFQKYYHANRDNFQGFPQSWNSRTGGPDPTSIHWEKDAAFLLLALNYFGLVSSKIRKYRHLVYGLVSWLTTRSKLCELIVAEGVADMYAALTPFAKKRVVRQVIPRLRQCFFSKGQISSSDYEHNLNHIVRGALVFDDASGLAHLHNFARTETWKYDARTEITAYSALVGDSFINLEISAQVLLTWHFLPHKPARKRVELRTELEKLFLPLHDNPQARGLPYFVGNQNLGGAYDRPAMGPTCFLLFNYWRFNPFDPGKVPLI